MAQRTLDSEDFGLLSLSRTSRRNSMRMPSVCSTIHLLACGTKPAARVRGVAFDDLDVDADPCAVLDDGLLEALVDQSLLDGADGGDLAEQRDAERVVVGAGGRHGDGDDQAEDVDRQPALASVHLLGRVLPGRGRRDVHRGVDALRVDHDQARILRPPGLLPDLSAQQVDAGASVQRRRPARPAVAPSHGVGGGSHIRPGPGATRMRGAWPSGRRLNRSVRTLGPQGLAQHARLGRRRRAHG